MRRRVAFPPAFDSAPLWATPRALPHTSPLCLYATSFSARLVPHRDLYLWGIRADRTATPARRYSWPEACGVLERAVEESRKQKRRGTPNVSVFAGMSLPEPVVMPLHMPKRHVRFLHALHAEARRAASLPPPTDADTKARGQALLEGPAAADGDDHGGSNGIKVEGEKADNGVAKDAEDGVGKVKEEGMCPVAVAGTVAVYVCLSVCVWRGHSVCLTVFWLSCLPGCVCAVCEPVSPARHNRASSRHCSQEQAHKRQGRCLCVGGQVGPPCPGSTVHL